LTGSFKVPMGCRSFLQGWKDENGVEVNSGRMNLGVVTVNLPRIALESEGDMNKFWEIFNERMNIAEDALVYRVERTKEATPANAPILYQYGAFGHRLGKEENVNQLFKNRRATVSLGYIGLYEVATVFFGNSWEHNPEAKEFTLDIIRDMKRRVEEWSD
ncbi:anaerobic ribonucleoside-triphosphate reductase, partial [[Eubacterium] siraeum]|nr:anaerobic ribonucleoside-triphosphate reductase [[Eubacterium] siraeum]